MLDLYLKISILAIVSHAFKPGHEWLSMWSLNIVCAWN
jgi:hypothetical protein